jgi:hypothetical protein
LRFSRSLFTPSNPFDRAELRRRSRPQGPQQSFADEFLFHFQGNHENLIEKARLLPARTRLTKADKKISRRPRRSILGRRRIEPDTSPSPSYDREALNCASFSKTGRTVESKTALAVFAASRKESSAMTIIEIRPHPWGWKVFEMPGVEPVFSDTRQAISYATERFQFFRSAEIRVINSAGQVEQIVIQAAESDKALFV